MNNKKYLYNCPSSLIPMEINSEQILKEYYPYWEKRMVNKFGRGHELITEENCIEDWCVVHWAWEKSNINNKD